MRCARQCRADLIVVGTHGRTGIGRLVEGSVCEDVLRNAKCPVLVVRPKDYSADDGIEIEPPCVDCLQARTDSGGATLWCARHSAHHPHAHLATEAPQALDLDP